jgi:hypothetical protein
MNCVITRGYKKRMEQNLEEKLGTLSASYMERTTKEMLPSQIIAVGTSIPNVKMETKR